LTTHYLEEAEALCDYIAIIDHGRVIAREATQALVRRFDSKEVVLTLGQDVTTVPASLARFDASLEGPRRLRLRYRPTQVRFGEILAAVQSATLEVTDLTTVEPDLEDIFLLLTRRTPAAAPPPSPAAASPGARRP
jgi:ABC-2 type transport system ATP-binding protein